MPIDIITSYRTSDGTLFEDQAKAEKHQDKLEFVEWYSMSNADEEYINDLAEFQGTAEKLHEWLVKHRGYLWSVVK